MINFCKFQCPTCRQYHYRVDGKRYEEVPTLTCYFFVNLELPPEDRRWVQCPYCWKLQPPGRSFDPVEDAKLERQREEGKETEPPVYTPPVKKTKDGRLIYWHFNEIPALEVKRGAKGITWQDRYSLALRQAPGCLDVLPFEEVDQFRSRVGSLRGLPDTMETQDSLRRFYYDWFNNPVNWRWLPRNIDRERLGKYLSRAGQQSQNPQREQGSGIGDGASASSCATATGVVPEPSAANRNPRKFQALPWQPNDPLIPTAGPDPLPTPIWKQWNHGSDKGSGGHKLLAPKADEKNHRGGRTLPASKAPTAGSASQPDPTVRPPSMHRMNPAPPSSTHASTVPSVAELASDALMSRLSQTSRLQAPATAYAEPDTEEDLYGCSDQEESAPPASKADGKKAKRDKSSSAEPASGKKFKRDGPGNGEPAGGSGKGKGKVS